MTLYTMEILEILSRESENTQHVYVYEENGRWYANLSIPHTTLYSTVWKLT